MEKNGIWDDVWSANPTDHRINFQVWLYENGVIEIHFGEIDLANTPFFSDTAGFIWSDGDTYGPWIEIGNFDLSEVYCVSGTSSNIIIITVEDSTDIFYGIPTNGQYFRWVPDEVSGVHPEKVLKKDEFIIYPNPAREALTIRFKSDSFLDTNLEIYTESGQLVTSLKLKAHNEKISISNLPEGIYIIRLSNENYKVFTKKIIKY